MFYCFKYSIYQLQLCIKHHAVLSLAIFIANFIFNLKKIFLSLYKIIFSQGFYSLLCKITY